MTCTPPMPLYDNPPFRGVKTVESRGDGYTVDLEWYRAFWTDTTYSVAYNIYYSTNKDDVFREGVKYVVTDGTQLTAHIPDLIPGDVYYFAVRGTLYDPDELMISSLPEINGFKIYPESLLLNDIDAYTTSIPVVDLDLFPPVGIVQIGAELITYTSLDFLTNSLINAVRGQYGTEARFHNVDGYDGVRDYDNPLVRIFKGFEDDNMAIDLEENNFFYPNFARTDADGYKEITKDLLTTDLSASDTKQEDFKGYDYAGYRRTDPVALISGKCVGSYYGGEHYCADGYSGVGRQVRGLTFSDINNQRQELVLSLTGEPVVLVKRLWTGIVCRCVANNKETPEHRCGVCFGTGFVTGYKQYFNPRRSDGRIMVRFDATIDDLVVTDTGLEAETKPNAWTLTVPTVKDRDFLIRFDGASGQELYRLEVLSVTRNVTMLTDMGAQKMTLTRVRKTSPIYQWRAFRDTSTMPSELTTSIGSVPGPGGILPHSHAIKISENISDISQINQTTSVERGHNHSVINGIVQPVLGHSHDIVFP